MVACSNQARGANSNARRQVAHQTLIDADTLAALIADRAVAVFDCSFDLADPASGRAAFLASHIPGAAYLNLDEDLSAQPDGHNGRHPLPDRDAFAARMAAAGVDAGRQVVAYDRSGGPYAARLWWMLRWAGHNAVAVLDGGLRAWTDAGGSLEHGEAHLRAPGSFMATPSLARTVAADDILASLGTDSLLVVDARAADRFRGEPNPLDPVAGHIPGARNRFYRDNLGADGRFLPPAALAAAFDAVIGDTPLDRVALQCGSGVTAAHNLLAMEVADRSGAALYPGSWSEWISDPTRPVERGA